MRRFGLAQARSLGHKAVDMAQPGVERLDALEWLGDLCMSIGDGDSAYDSFARALEEARSSVPEDRSAIARLCAKAVIIPTRWLGSLPDSISADEIDGMLEEGLEAAGPGDGWSRNVLLSAKAFEQGMGLREINSEGPAAAEEAVAMARRLNDADLESRALDALGGLLLPEGRYAEIAQLLRRRLELVPRLTQPIEIGDTYSMSAWTETFIGRYAEAIEHATAAMDHSRDLARASTYTVSRGASWRASTAATGMQP
jgi:tetratricopeptide (TPR) repeat protein